MEAKEINANKIRRWVEKVGFIGAIKKVHAATGDGLGNCVSRVRSLRVMWEKKGTPAHRKETE